MPPKAVILGMNGCLHCENAREKLGSNPDFQFVQCHGPNSVDPNSSLGQMCQGVEGFPTMKKMDGTTCNVGMGNVADIVSKCT